MAEATGHKVTKSVTSRNKGGGYKGGSRKGIPNKSTQNAREAIARLVDGNTERMQEWLDRIAEEEGPMAAWRCMTDVIEYHVPKLSRTELTGANGGPVRVIADPHDEAL